MLLTPKLAALDKTTGTLSVGKAADLVVLDAGKWNMFPMNNAVGLTVLQAHVGNVDTVMVKGTIVKQDGKLLGHDQKRIRAGIDATRDHLFQNANLERGYDFQPGEPGSQWLW